MMRNCCDFKLFCGFIILIFIQLSVVAQEMTDQTDAIDEDLQETSPFFFFTFPFDIFTTEGPELTTEIMPEVLTTESDGVITTESDDVITTAMAEIEYECYNCNKRYFPFCVPQNAHLTCRGQACSVTNILNRRGHPYQSRLGCIDASKCTNKYRYNNKYGSRYCCFGDFCNDKYFKTLKELEESKTSTSTSSTSTESTTSTSTSTSTTTTAPPAPLDDSLYKCYSCSKKYFSLCVPSNKHLTCMGEACSVTNYLNNKGLPIQSRLGCIGASLCTNKYRFNNKYGSRYCCFGDFCNDKYFKTRAEVATTTTSTSTTTVTMPAEEEEEIEEETTAVTPHQSTAQPGIECYECINKYAVYCLPPHNTKTCIGGACSVSHTRNSKGHPVSSKFTCIEESLCTRGYNYSSKFSSRRCCKTPLCNNK